MTVPFIPTTGYNAGQAFTSAVQAFLQQREQKRQRDMQNMQIWEHILPGLTQYVAPTSTSIPDVNGGPPTESNLPEMFATPQPPKEIASALQRLTGQTNMGLTPDQQNAMRQGYVNKQTLSTQIAKPKAELDATVAGTQNTQASTRATDASIPLTQARTAGQNIVNQQGSYELGVQPTKDASDWVLKNAPGFVLDAASAMGVSPSIQNADKIAQLAWQKFQQSNSPFSRYITPEQFGGAIFDQIKDLEGLSNDRMRTRAAMAAAAPDYTKYLAQSVDDDRMNLAQMDARKKALEQNIGVKAYLNGGIVTDQNSLPMIEEYKSMFTPGGPFERLKHRLDENQSKLNARVGGSNMQVFGPAAQPGTPGASAQGGPPALPGKLSPDDATASLDAVMPGVRSAALKSMVRNGALDVDTAMQIARQKGILISKADLDAVAMRRP